MVGNGGVICAFEIRVKNQGPANFNGAVVVHDAFTPAIPPALFLSAPPGLCNPAGGGYDCTTPVLSLVPGQSYPFFVGFRMPIDTKVCDVRNVARITSPAGGSVLNFNPANDQGAASVHLPLPNCVERPRTDLSLTKTSAPCQLRLLTRAGTALECFDVTVKNEGPGNYSGPIQFQDQPSVTALGLNGGSNATCSPVGTGFTCASNGNVALAPGNSVTYNVALAFSTQDGKVCRVINRARLTIPAAPGAQNTNPANDLGQDSAQVTTPECSQVVAPAQQCPLNQVMPGGGCCDNGLIWNGRQCAAPPNHKPPPIRPVCPKDSHVVDGTCVCDAGTHGDPGYCRPDSTGPVCPKDSHVQGGTCVCNARTHGDPGYCRPDSTGPVCPKDSYARGGVCVCDPGTHGQPGRCLPDIKIVPIPLCPTDSHWNADRKVCQCNPPTRGVPGRCQAPTGNGNTGPLPPRLCPTDSHWNVRANACQCNAGTIGDPGHCRVPSTGGPLKPLPLNVIPKITPQCPSDSHWNARANACQCNAPLTGRPGACVAPKPTLQINPKILQFNNIPQGDQIR